MNELNKLAQMVAQGKIGRREFLVRAVKLGVSAAVASSFLAACAPAPPAEVTPEEAAPAPAPEVKKEVTIKMAHFYDPLQSPAAKANVDWIDKVVADFTAKNPNVKVEQELFQWDQIDNRAILDYQAGVKHDLFFSSPQLMAKHFEVGDFVDLTPYLKTWSESDLKDFNWSPVWASGKLGDVQIGVPTGVHTRSVAYRRDFFKEAGLDPDKPPTTWEECLEAAKATTKGDVYGLGMYFGPSRATIELYFAPFIWHFGGDLWDPTQKKATFASEAGIKAGQLISDLVYTHKVTPEAAAGGTYDEVILKAFLENKLAMGWGWGSYWIASLNENEFIKNCFPPGEGCTEDTGGVFVTPTVPKAQFTNAWTLSIHKLSDHPEEAFLLMTHLLKPEFLIDFPDAGLPARLSYWERPELSTPFYKKWLEAARNGKPMPPTVYYPELADTCAAALQEILVGKAPVDETLKKFEGEWNAKYAGK